MELRGKIFFSTLKATVGAVHIKGRGKKFKVFNLKRRGFHEAI
tara:strand:+ start:478 stop:606 length:129 start_codon:yes stop_codon:yes gene_type:complete